MVRQAGQDFRALRRFGRGVFLLLVALGLVTQWPHGRSALQPGLVAAAGLLMVGALIRHCIRIGLRRRLAALSDEQLTRTLLPLQGDASSDVRRLTTALLRERQVHPTDLLPSAPPAARGDELVPAGEGAG